MLDVKNSNRIHPSLLPLRMALIAAESGVPSQPVQYLTIDEQRAQTLIEKMKAGYDKPTLVKNFVRRTQKSNIDFELKLQAWEVVNPSV